MTARKDVSREIANMKRKAKKIARSGGVAHSRALDLVAQDAGYASYADALKRTLQRNQEIEAP